MKDGTHQISARAFDAAGNQSVITNKLALSIDSDPPDEPVVTTLTPTALIGIAEPSSRITVMEGLTKLGSATTNAGGAWTVPTVFTAGAHMIEISAADVAGNTAMTKRAVFIGTGAAETIAGGPLLDILVGLGGDDLFDVNDPGDLVIEAVGGGADTVRASTNYTLPFGSRIKFLQAAAGATNLTLEGNEFDNAIMGSSGADILNGFAGADTLTGGAGPDVFRVSAIGHSTVAPVGRDLIPDFSVADGDTLDFAQIDANTATGGDDAFSFLGSGAFTSAAGQLRSVVAGGFTTVSGDVTGDGVADFAVRLTGSHTLTAGQFGL